MLRKATELTGYTVRATDGDIGSVSTLYFDDDRWAVRYFVVDTGTWMPGRRILISPISVRQVSLTDRALDVSLTRQQVKDSPDVDTHLPVSRQYEINYYGYYGYHSYWGGPGLWGAEADPTLLARAEADRKMAEAAGGTGQALQDSHLRDTSDVKGYHIRATDGEIGHVDDFLMDDRTWAIRYLVVDTSNWLGGRHVLVAPAWVTSVSWDESKVLVSVARQSVKDSPEFNYSRELNREYEEQLHAHYGQTPYWADQGPASKGVMPT